MSRYGTVLGSPANAVSYIVQGATVEALLAASGAAGLAAFGPIQDPVITSITLTGAGDGHMFFLEVQGTEGANADGGISASTISVQAFLGAEAEVLTKALQAVQGASPVVDVQIAGAAKGQRVLGLVIMGTLRGGGTEDHKVAATATDTSPDYLLPKLTAGNNVTLTLQNGGGNESVKIDAAGVGTVRADNGAVAYPLPTFPAFTTVATTAVVSIAAGKRVLPASRVLAEITTGGGTMSTGVLANPIVPAGAPILIDFTESTVAGSPKQTLTSAGAEVTLPPGTYTFSLVVSSTALVTGSVPATGGGYPIPPAVLTVMILPP